MIDPEMFEKLYEAGQGGAPICFGVFDKRVLLPLAQLPEAVQAEGGEAITLEAAIAKSELGWFPILPMEGGEGELGFPLYAPSRVGLLLKLEREGFDPLELRGVAEMEEWSIDNLYAADDLAYQDDDLETVISYKEAQLEAFSGAEGEDSPEVTKLKKAVVFLKSLKANGIPDRLQAAIQKDAFMVRAMNEGMRVMMMENDRAKIRAGYSPWTSFRRYTIGADGLKDEEVDWKGSIQWALAYEAEDGAKAPLRVPGFVLRGDLVTPTRTMPPSEYAAAWRERGIEDYLATWRALRGERACLNCHKPITEGPKAKSYCSDRCRNAAKQRRYREQNPEAILKTQERYWKQFDDG